MARPDLPKGYDGWQVIDATPQESSDGRFSICLLNAITLFWGRNNLKSNLIRNNTCVSTISSSFILQANTSVALVQLRQ